MIAGLLVAFIGEQTGGANGRLSRCKHHNATASFTEVGCCANLSKRQFQWPVLTVKPLFPATANYANNGHLIPTMAPPLQAILDAELEAGNTIVEVSAWLPKCRLIVILGHQFGTRPRDSAGVTFHQINDPHYWKAEYRYDDGSEVLACRF